MGKIHWADCAVNNAPAYKPGDCSCGMGTMKYVLSERRGDPGAWGVEAINYDGDGEIYMAIFSGPFAREMAEEYMLFANGD